MKIFFSNIIFILYANVIFAGDSYQCSYFQSEAKDLMIEKNCITYSKNTRNKVTGGDALISKKVAISASYDENGLSYLYSPVGVFYFTNSGLVRKTLNYDNGPDYFKDELARTEWNGKIGFFDKNLSIIIEPLYDFAFPFENGLSIVCNGCNKNTIGEHTELMGGHWGAINRKGELVYNIVHTEAELRKILKDSLNN